MGGLFSNMTDQELCDATRMLESLHVVELRKRLLQRIDLCNDTADKLEALPDSIIVCPIVALLRQP